VVLKVSHEIEEMGEGEARILTFKDSCILDNEGTYSSSKLTLIHSISEDELHNIEMVEEERRQKNQDLKVKKRGYSGYDDDEFVAGNAGVKRTVLAKYDENIEYCEAYLF
jgi:U4/U6.U5 tri-snRNP-associated protein 1